MAEICSDAYPDHFALNPESKYFDPKSSPENPIWFMRDVAFIKKFKHCLTLQQMKEQPALNGLMVIKTGTRLSIQPVHDTHAKLLLNLLNG